jgi:hypothetical protein
VWALRPQAVCQLGGILDFLCFWDAERRRVCVFLRVGGDGAWRVQEEQQRLLGYLWSAARAACRAFPVSFFFLCSFLTRVDFVRLCLFLGDGCALELTLGGGVSSYASAALPALCLSSSLFPFCFFLWVPLLSSPG